MVGDCRGLVCVSPWGVSTVLDVAVTGQNVSVFGLHVVVGEECMARQALDWQQNIARLLSHRRRVGY